MTNSIMNGLEHIGHWLHVAERDTIGAAVNTIHRGIKVADDLRSQFPTLGQETAAVAADVIECKTLAAAIALAVAGDGLNLAADAGVLAALVKDGPAIIRLFNDAALLVKTAGHDIDQDVRDLAGVKPTENPNQ